MAVYGELVEAFTIFSQYPGEQSIAAEHDVIYAGPDPDKVSTEDLARLAVLGWTPSEEDACFQQFT